MGGTSPRSHGRILRRIGVINAVTTVGVGVGRIAIAIAGIAISIGIARIIVDTITVATISVTEAITCARCREPKTGAAAKAATGKAIAGTCAKVATLYLSRRKIPADISRADAGRAEIAASGMRRSKMRSAAAKMTTTAKMTTAAMRSSIRRHSSSSKNCRG